MAPSKTVQKKKSRQKSKYNLELTSDEENSIEQYLETEDKTFKQYLRKLIRDDIKKRQGGA